MPSAQHVVQRPHGDHRPVRAAVDLQVDVVQRQLEHERVEQEIDLGVVAGNDGRCPRRLQVSAEERRRSAYRLS